MGGLGQLAKKESSLRFEVQITVDSIETTCGRTENGDVLWAIRAQGKCPIAAPSAC
jgi:hypothetical protein